MRKTSLSYHHRSNRRITHPCIKPRFLQPGQNPVRRKMVFMRIHMNLRPRKPRTVNSCLASTIFTHERQLFLPISGNYDLDEIPMI